MRYVAFFLHLLVSTITICHMGYAQDNKRAWNWSMMPPVPDAFGFAGAFAGKLAGGFILAGGANFPDGRLPWDGGTKRWTDKVFFLENNGTAWLQPGRLPVPLGYGASASWDDALYVAGGSNEKGHHDKTYKITVDAGALHITALPPLPMPLANMSGILVGSWWYIVGGLATPDAPAAENVCYRMDLAHAGRGWEVCAPLPGEGRMLAVLGTDAAALYVFSGVALREGQRQYLTDSYRFDPAAGWKKLPDLPRAVAAAPSPCFFDRPSNSFFIFGGDDGGLAQQQLGAAHPGFSRSVHMFDVDAGEWDHQQVMDLHGSLPPVTTTAVVDENTVILPMGEVKPGIRTTHVLQGSILRHEIKKP